MPLDLGMLLPHPETGVRIPDAARMAETLGLDSLWSGDHLMTGSAVLDAPITLATAAAVTERIGVGLGVYLPALRQPVWAAKHIGTLAHLIPDRFRLGVGLGGRIGTGPSEWDAAGVPWAGRAARTDTFLGKLDRLLAAEPTELDSLGTVTLAPAVPKPPVWIGGTAEASLRRAARFGEGWLGAFATPRRLRESVDRLGEFAREYERPRPRVGLVLHGGLLDRARTQDRERLAARLAATYGMDPADARAVLLVGGPEQATEQIAALIEAGADLFAFVSSTPWRRSCELLARVRELLR